LSETETPDDLQKQLPTIRVKYRLKTLELIQDASDVYHIQGSVNPKMQGKLWRRPADLPSWSKLTVDWQHIFDGHWEGSTQPRGNNTIFTNLNQNQIKSVVRIAYENVSEKLRTQKTPEGDRILVRGQSGTWTVEMWINKATKVLETAYPVFS
jgi:hypothetical protein